MFKLSVSECRYLADLTVRLLEDIPSFEFSDTDKYALMAIVPKISASMGVDHDGGNNLNGD